MTNRLIDWHLARDDYSKLASFCEKHRIKQEVVDRYKADDGNYFTIKFDFDNGAFILAELRAGDTQSYTIADHFAVVDYGYGTDPKTFIEELEQHKYNSMRFQ